MIQEKSEAIIQEVSRTLVGKEEVIRKVLMAIYANGHVLLEDVPGVGKTTLAVAFAKSLDMECRRVQFTPDTMPSDLTGFTMYNREKGEFSYVEGAVVCNLFLGDEINRASAKTQSALLEAMEERAVTVDGKTRRLPSPFICIATQNPSGSAGTQYLPESQLDRFMVKLSIGYPGMEEQISILRERTSENPLDYVKKIASRDEITEVQNYLYTVKMTDDMMKYMTRLCEKTRDNPYIELGVSPRGIIALSRMARACAILDDRDHVIPSDVKEVFADVCAHRMIMRSIARLEDVSARDVLDDILAKTDLPTLGVK